MYLDNFMILDKKTFCLRCIIKNKIINKLIIIESLSYLRQVQFLSFIFQNPLFTKSGKSVMMYCDIKVSVIMMLFVTCCFAFIIEEYDINKEWKSQCSVS